MLHRKGIAQGLDIIIEQDRDACHLPVQRPAQILVRGLSQVAHLVTGRLQRAADPARHVAPDDDEALVGTPPAGRRACGRVPLGSAAVARTLRFRRCSHRNDRGRNQGNAGHRNRRSAPTTARNGRRSPACPGTGVHRLCSERPSKAAVRRGQGRSWPSLRDRRQCSSVLPSRGGMSVPADHGAQCPSGVARSASGLRFAVGKISKAHNPELCDCRPALQRRGRAATHGRSSGGGDGSRDGGLGRARSQQFEPDRLSLVSRTDAAAVGQLMEQPHASTGFVFGADCHEAGESRMRIGDFAPQ